MLPNQSEKPAKNDYQLEALPEWPKFGLGTLGGIVTREIKNARRRKKLAATDTQRRPEDANAS